MVAHPGGPFFKNKDEGWWSIPKGEPDPGEDIFLAALREFEGGDWRKIPRPIPRSWVNYPKKREGGICLAFAGDWEDGKIPVCNEITMEYPKGTGKMWTFPEIDHALLLPTEEAKQKLRPEQAVLVDRLIERLPSIADAKAGKD